MTETTFTCDIRGKTTVLTVRGALDDDVCAGLEDMLRMCRTLRGTGTMVVDLADVSRLSFPALVVLHRAAEEARRIGRPLILRELRARPEVARPHRTRSATAPK
jgi:anti-anti-sigma regulatory factor